MNKKIFPILKKQPTCIGTGLVALDIVFNGKPKVPPRFWAGGSCGNVLTILSYLGWKSLPIIRIGNDEAATRILKDWAKFSVSQELIDNDINVSTPIIVEQIKTGRAGFPTHKFYWICPNCGGWLPRYRPLLLQKAKQTTNRISESNIFYFDRVSPAALMLAEEARKNQAIVFFEPPSLKNDKFFRKAIELSNIVKIAAGQISEENILKNIEGPTLLIQTLGAEGIRYKFGKKDDSKNWKHLPPFPVIEFKDAAGAGDWCSAGIIHFLGGKKKVRIETLPEKRIIKALEFGQAMAALNCSYEGARGTMYAMNKTEFELAIEQILEGKIVEGSMPEEIPQGVSEMLLCLCPGCIEKKAKSKVSRKKLSAKKC